MNDLILIVYAIDLLVALKALSAFVMVLLAMSTFIIVLIKLVDDGCVWEPVRDALLRHKKLLTTIICSCLAIGILVPKERTLYIMSGLYVGGKVVNTISTSETFSKAEKLLNKKLDEMLEEKENE